MNSAVHEHTSGSRDMRGLPRDLSPDLPFVITFSGIDGAGKTTQIENLSAHLHDQGLGVLRLSFWDDVAVWANLRSEAGQHAARLHSGREAADAAFTARNHKHIRKWYLTAARSGLYMLDVLHLRRVLRSRRSRSFDVVIFDRYIYDQIANIHSHLSATRLYSQVLLKLAPRPDLAFILDASPEVAFARKPEYPIDFIHKNRESFLRQRELAPNLIVLPAAGVEETKNEIHNHLRQSRLAKAALGKITEGTAKGTLGWEQSSCRVQNEPTTGA